MKGKFGLAGAMVAVLFALFLVAGCGGSSSSSDDGGSGSGSTDYNSRLDGTFATASFEPNLDASGDLDDCDANGGDLVSNGDGTGTMGGDDFTYEMASDNTFDLTASGSTDKGLLNPDGNFLASIDTDESDSGISLAVALKTDSISLGDDDVNGDWTVFQIRYNSDDGRIHTSALKMEFTDGTGTHTATATPLLDSDSGAGGSDITASYTVGSDGQMTLPAFGLSGYMDSSRFVLVDDDPAGDNEVKIMIGIKRGSGLSNASLKGDYQMMRIEADASDSWTVHADLNFKGDEDSSGNGTFDGTIVKVSDGSVTAGTAVSGTYAVVDSGTGVIAVSGGSSDYSALSSDGEILVACDATTGTGDDEVALIICVKKHE